ncbi:MAG TPA: sialate O-acetylesterase [Phycisphaerae bacterium]|nr:sialate O-acetylesterase [Phycisphaerae bacterium]
MPRFLSSTTLMVCFLLGVWPRPGFAAISLSGLFTDHMVLQQEMPIRIWGSADPGEQVTVSFGNANVQTGAGSDGRWMVELPSEPANSQSRDLTIAGATDRVVIHDVLVGEVWICSGQSNMEFAMTSGWHQAWTPGGHLEPLVASANNPQIRLFKVPHAFYAAPSEKLDAQWQLCTPQTVASFTAVGYLFGRELSQKLNVPVGLIQSTWGGTRIEPWISLQVFEDTPQFQKDLNWLHAAPHVSGPIPIATTPSPSTTGSAANRPPTMSSLSRANTWSRESPTAIYNGMISPLIPYTVRGAIWYQGESNVSERDRLYYLHLSSLIDSWRKVWNQGDFPFYIVQIAPYGGYHVEPQYEPLIWEAEEQVAQKIPNTGVAGIMDIGNLSNIHPADKIDVAHRLALWALAKTYGQSDLVYSGPIYKSMEVDQNKIIIHFDEVGGGFVSRDRKPLNWFEIAGADKKFVPAQAQVIGDTIVVESQSVSDPVAVRFGWSDIAEPNLMNKEGLPALPFRTDQW